MKKIVIIFISFLILFSTSCEEKPSIMGVWQISYSISDKGQTNPIYDNTLFDFGNDTLSIVQIGNLETANYREMVINKAYYSLQDSLLLIDNKMNALDSTSNFSVTNDSICIRIEELNSTIVLKKSTPRNHDNIPLKSDLIGNAFEFQIGTDFKRRLNFINDSIVLVDSDYFESYWTILRYKNFDFISSNNYIYLPKISITKSDSGVFQLTGNYTKTYNYELQPVQPKFSKKQIIGDWLETERSFVQPHLLAEQNAPLERLKITDKTFIRSRNNSRFSFNWKLSPDGRAIFFPKQNGKKYYTEKIIELSDSSMVLHKLNQHHLGDSIAIRFKRIITSQ